MGFFNRDVFLNVILPQLRMKEARFCGISSAAYSQFHYFTRLQFLKLPNSPRYAFLTLEAVMACDSCKRLQLAAFCKHHESMLPSWLSKEGTEFNRVVYDYLGADKAAERELSNVQGNSAGQAFTAESVQRFYNRSFYSSKEIWDKPKCIFVGIDPNAGGVSHMAIVSLMKTQGNFWVVCIFIISIYFCDVAV